MYNIFTSHGPDIYGTEPWHFYIFNGILNFNVVFLLSLAAWPGKMQGLVPELHSSDQFPE